MAQDTVLIRHLSPLLNHSEKSDLLRHFGAIDVKIVGPEGKRPNLVYAKYENIRAAELAIQKLHQLNVLGRRLSAELAQGHAVDISEPQKFSIHSVNDDKQDRILKAKEAFLKKLGISLKDYDFNQPPPLNIYYQYPPPTRLVLENICKAMANTPKLYNQVLHLMNKMNLPCPFVDKYPMESELFREKIPESLAEDVRNSQDGKIIEEEMSEDESEMGSDTEHQRGEIIPVKRKKVARKAIKRPKFLKPIVPPIQNTGSKTGLKPDDVFENAQKEPVQKKIEFTITADLSSIQEAKEFQNIESSEEGFKVIKVSQKAPEKPIESENKEESNMEELSVSCITAEQLAANRVSARDQRLLPVFKNYQPGAPSCRLYIKNLAKQVTTRDLHFIYRRYYKPELDQEQGTMFDIRLMQEGRMKGQAFITLQSVEQTQNALKETNGYILKDKPMVVQFARSAAAK